MLPSNNKKTNITRVYVFVLVNVSCTSVQYNVYKYLHTENQFNYCLLVFQIVSCSNVFLFLQCVRLDDSVVGIRGELVCSLN